MLGKKFSRQHFDFVHYIQKVSFDFSCKLSPKDTICMKSQILFSQKKMTLMSAEFSSKVLNVSILTAIEV